MKNNTNVIKYRFLAPIYDPIFSLLLFKARKRALSLLDFKNGDTILLAGIGTGLDLPFIPNNCSITGIDLSEEMLQKAKSKIGDNLKLILMNAEKLEFPDQIFDFVILNLILSVTENPRKVMIEAIRTLKENGSILIFDKFLKGEKAGIARKTLNKLTSFVGTDITRSFEELTANLPIKVIKEETSLFRGNYRIIILKKA